jgi:hypothetical protein
VAFGGALWLENHLSAGTIRCSLLARFLRATKRSKVRVTMLQRGERAYRVLAVDRSERPQKKFFRWREMMNRSEVLMKKLLPLAPFRWDSGRTMNGVVKSRVKSLKGFAPSDRQVGLADLPSMFLQRLSDDNPPYSALTCRPRNDRSD